MSDYIGSGDTTARRKRDSQIHLVLRPENFSDAFDYDGVIARPACLASRILKSQQSYQFFFALFFGSNIKSRVPYGSANLSPPALPEEYRSIRGIGQVTPVEIKAIDEQLNALSGRLRFSLRYAPDGGFAVTEAESSQEQERGCRSTIYIGQDFYNAVSREQRPKERALLDFAMAYTLLHELAHAANNHIMGDRTEDFFEDSLIAEAGFEYISRLFGMQPTIVPEKIAEPVWDCWQTLTFLNPKTYFHGEYCRNVSKLPTEKISHPFDPSFAERLLDDAWWEVEADRSVDLIPDFLLQREYAHLFRVMPSSLQQWLQGEIGEGASAGRHGDISKPSELKLRDLAPLDATPLEVDDHHPNLREKQGAGRTMLRTTTADD